MNILLGVTGSVAACLTPKLVKALGNFGPVKVVLTEKGRLMATGFDIDALDRIYDSDEWPEWPARWRKGDPICHVDIKNWADILVIAPCSANTLAKMANGICDNLLTSIVRAWPTYKPVFVAPAMNTDMWDKPVTRRHLATLQADFPFFHVIEPQEKVLACGDQGMGAMAEIPVLVRRIWDATRWWNPLRQYPLFIPVSPHPGAFGAVRKHDVHTGVDLYTHEDALVYAVEPGVVVDIVDFTGSKVTDQQGQPMSWWNDTKAVLVKGTSGVVVYGEIAPYGALKVGTRVDPGDPIGGVAAVLPPHKIRPDIPNHSNAMLHIELYESVAAEKDFRWKAWDVGGPRPAGLLDPTYFLQNLGRG